jgi:hypothetical protein
MAARTPATTDPKKPRRQKHESGASDGLEAPDS